MGFLSGLFGGGDDASDISSPYEQFMQQFSTYKDATPGYLSHIKGYEPKFLGHQLDMQKKFGVPFMTQRRTEQEAGNPEYYNALKKLDDALMSRGNLTSLAASPELLDAYRQDIRKGQYSRGMTLSPISAAAEAQQTLGARISERDKWLNLAGAMAGRVPFMQSQNVTSNRMNDMGVPQISSMSSLQQQANAIAYSQWEAGQRGTGAGLGSLGSLFQGGGMSDIFGGLFEGSGNSPNLSQWQGSTPLSDSQSTINTLKATGSPQQNDYVDLFYATQGMNL